MAKQKKIILYQSYLCKIGGVETFIYNWCYSLRNYYDVLVLYGGADEDQLSRLSRIVNVELYNKLKTYTCDILLRNSVWGDVPYNIEAKRKIEMRHADYKYLLEKGRLYQQYRDMGIREIVACGEHVGKMSSEVLHDNPIVIPNILAPRVKTNKIIRLISCTRLDSEKGWDLMQIMMKMMDEAKIKFQWDIFTRKDNFQRCDREDVHFHESRFDIWDYLANSDYTVLLSKVEGKPYTVQESLQYQVPCIVTDIPGCTEMVKDGVNGYVVPLDMNFDIKRILNIPKCPEYDNHALEKWLEYLGNSKYENKGIEKEYLKGDNFMIELEVLKSIPYSKYDELVSIKRKGIDKKGEILAGDIIVVSTEEEAKYLCGENQYNLVACKILRVIPKKEDGELETADKKQPKKTEKAVKNVRKTKVLQDK